MTVHVAGLGPGDPGLVTAEVLALLASGLPVIARTRHHPTVAALDPAGRFEDCDGLYRAGADFEEVYAAVAERVIERARVGSVVFAVPGHPLVSETAVVRVLEAATRAGIDVRIHAGLSYVDLAAAALGRDLGAVQVNHSAADAVDPTRPLIIGQAFDRDTATDLKLRLLDLYPAAHPVTVLRALGTAGQEVRPVPLAELDHGAFGHLDTLFVPPLAPEEDVRRFEGLWQIVRRLHAPGGCPWDREQTHASLRPHLLEEAYEALEAIDANDEAAMAEELGDVLLQVMMHAAVAEREEEFTAGDVAEQIARKLIRRHPHVFAGAKAESAEDVREAWEVLKKREKPQGSILDGVPASLPALAASQAIQGRARRAGFDWPDIEGPLEKLREEVAEFAHAGNAPEREAEFGDILFVLANVAQRNGIDAEQALRGANVKFRRRFAGVEALAAARGVDLKALDLAGLDALWDEVKAAEAR